MILATKAACLSLSKGVSKGKKKSSSGCGSIILGEE
jgi:hypothetical protein